MDSEKIRIECPRCRTGIFVIHPGQKSEPCNCKGEGYIMVSKAVYDMIQKKHDVEPEENN